MAVGVAYLQPGVPDNQIFPEVNIQEEYFPDSDNELIAPTMLYPTR